MPRRPVVALVLVLGAALATALAAAGCGDERTGDEARPVASDRAGPGPGDPGSEVTGMASSGPGSAEALATFGGGCFWCTEAVYLRIEGVLGVRSGYAGGTTPNPTYEQVSTGKTGHAEVVQVRFDPTKVPYERLLEVFFRTHDPTTKDRQGADVGTQYRSIVLAHDAAQRATAERVKKALDASGAFDAPIVTEIVPFDRFYPAEEYHQDYFAQNPLQGYCRAVVAPKVAKFEKAFADLLKKAPPR